ncbi:transposase [Spirulina subsalsa]|uniref:transposase n=1 Tax=Spirulina subsalsa TaxID=54311 RepID=UPI002237B9BD|nr:transposase [Spirulina subsalsa]
MGILHSTYAKKPISRQAKGSQNRTKAQQKVAKVHSKTARCREDFLHKLSRKIVNENQVIAVENLNVKKPCGYCRWEPAILPGEGV